MPQLWPLIVSAGQAIGTAAAANPLAAISAGATGYNSLVQQPQQAQAGLDTQKNAYAKQGMSDFLKNQILRQQADQFKGMIQQQTEPDFLRKFLTQNINQGGGF